MRLVVSVRCVPEKTALRLARIHWGISTSATWGELASKVDAEILKEIVEDGERKSFEDFCSAWLYPALSWPLDVSTDWYRSCVEAYRNLPTAERYPLPYEICTAAENMSDGIWPEWPPALVFDWMPEAIWSEFGHLEHCLHDYSYPKFDPGKREAVCKRLEEAGFKCLRNHLLVQASCGTAIRLLGADKLRAEIERTEARLRLSSNDRAYEHWKCPA
jgi:hypothetical protein